MLCAIMGSVPDTSPAFPVVLGLGANEGEPRAQLVRAIQELRSAVEGPVWVAGLYQSAAIGPEQPDFLNSAALLDFPGEPLALLELTQAIEQRLGRIRRGRWGPRRIDLDLLWAGERQVRSARLTVPHAQLTARAFALLPLLELCPEAADPEDGQLYRSLLPRFHSQRIQKIDSAGWELVP